MREKLQNLLSGTPEKFLSAVLLGLGLFAIYAALAFGPLEKMSVILWYTLP